MATRSIEQQIAMLRPAVRFAAHMHTWLLLGAGLGVIAACAFWHPLPLLVSAFLAIVGLSERRAGPNIAAAISAYDSGMSSLGEATISITRWDTDNHYHAVIHEPDHPDWKYEFVPQGWQPAQGTYPAKIWRAGTARRPVLAVVEEGIMIPRYEPTTGEPETH